MTHFEKHINFGRSFTTFNPYRDTLHGFLLGVKTSLISRHFGQLLRGLAKCSFIDINIALHLSPGVLDSCMYPSFLFLSFPFVASASSLVPFLLLRFSF